MKKLVMILSTVCFSNWLFAQEAFLTKSFPGAWIKEVESTASGGNISVESVAADQQRVEVFVWHSGKNKNASISKEETQKKLDEFYDLRVELNGGNLIAVAKPKHNNMNWKNSLSISFRIFTGKEVATTLTTSGGNIDLRAVSGTQKITTSGGNLNIDNVKGRLKGVTSGGDIDVKDSDDDIDLTTSGGNINSKNCNGKVRLSTSGGNVVLMGMNGDITATTSGGNVSANNIRGELDTHTSGGNVGLTGLACDLTAGTSGGDVKVAITTPVKFIKLSNSGGKIEMELPKDKGYDFDLSGDKIKTGGLVNFSGKEEDDQLKGTINGGGTKVTADAGGSKIILTLK